MLRLCKSNDEYSNELDLFMAVYTVVRNSHRSAEKRLRQPADPGNIDSHFRMEKTQSKGGGKKNQQTEMK